MRARRHTNSATAVARNAHPRLRLVAAPTRNPYHALQRANRTAARHHRSPRAGYRELVRRLWPAAA